MNSINESQVVNRFNFYLQDTNIQDALSMMLDDIEVEDLTEDQADLIADILIDEVVAKFAKDFSNLTESFGEQDPSKAFQTFCQFNNINEDLAQTIADVINKAVEKDHEESEDDDDDDNFIFTGEKAWQDLSASERQQKVRAFLKKISRAGIDAANLRPFIRNAIDDQEDSHGNRWGEKVKTFDRQKNRFDSASESIHFPDHHGTGYDELHRAHPLHKTLLAHGYTYSHTVAVNQPRGGVHHHHTWTHPHGFEVGSYEGDTQWSSKRSANSPVWTGVGQKSLSNHLENRNKRYRLQNDASLPNTKIQESLIDPEGYKRVARYADWLNKNPATAWGVEGSYAAANPVTDLMEAEQLKAKQQKIFDQGKPVDQWGILDFRSGKPK